MGFLFWRKHAHHTQYVHNPHETVSLAKRVPVSMGDLFHYISKQQSLSVHEIFAFSWTRKKFEDDLKEDILHSSKNGPSIKSFQA